MKVAVIVQRYGEAINGGAELHARYVAERLARHADVRVLTTCASDYVTWRNELPPGTETINGVQVQRFPVAHERDPIRFSRLSAQVFTQTHSIADELAWLDAEGPASPALVRHLERHGGGFDVCVFFSYRYYHAYHGVRAVASRAVLVPTAERDAAIGLSIFGPILRGVSALMYNSPEERAMIQAAAGNHDVKSVVVGVGSDVPDTPQPGRFRQAYGIRGPFAIYVGRIDENKGCKELFEHFAAYAASGGRFSLLLIGQPVLPIPDHPHIRHLGFLPDRDKFDAMAAADVLIMPSYFESLSMVALEAWALGRPVLANATCDVLKGQCLRSNAGLFYEDRDEFIETLQAFERNRWLGGLLGRNGRRFFREHYEWSVIERKYLEVLGSLSSAPPRAPGAIDPLPGWLERRRRVCRPGEEVAAGLPSGPALPAGQNGAWRPPSALAEATADRSGGGTGNRVEARQPEAHDAHRAGVRRSSGERRGGPPRPARRGRPSRPGRRG